MTTKAALLTLWALGAPAFAQAPVYTKAGSVFAEAALSPVELYQKEFGGAAVLGLYLDRDVAVQLKGTVRQSVKGSGLDENSRAVEIRYSPYPMGFHVEAGAAQVFRRDHEEFDDEECVKYTAQGPSFGAGWSKMKNEHLRLGISLFTAVIPRKERAEPCGSGSDFYKGYSHNVVVTSFLSGTIGIVY